MHNFARRQELALNAYTWHIASQGRIVPPELLRAFSVILRIFRREKMGHFGSMVTRVTLRDLYFSEVDMTNA